MTILSNLSRQLSVLIVALSATTVSAQGSAGTRNAINNQASMTYPGMPNGGQPTMYVKKITVGPTHNPEMLLQSFYFNEDLTLGVQYNYQFDIDFLVDAPNGRSPVPDGWYLLTVATFLKDGRMFDNPDVIDPDETLAMRYTTSNRTKLIRVAGGSAHPDVSLRFDNPSRASVDNTIYVEFRPIDCPVGNPNCVVLNRNGEPDVSKSPWVPRRGFAAKQYLMTAPWVPSTGVMSGGTDPSKKAAAETIYLREKGLDTFVNETETDRRKRAVEMNAQASSMPLSPRSYAAKHNLTYYDVEDAEIYDMGQAFYQKTDPRPVLRALLQTIQAGPMVIPQSYAKLQAVFCGLIAKNAIPGLTKQEQLNRQRINSFRISMCGQGEMDLQIRRITNIGQIIDPFAKGRQMDTLKGALMRNLSIGRSHDESAASVKTWKVLNTFFSWMTPAAPLAGPAFFLAKDVLGAIPFDWTHTVTVSNSQNKNESGILSMQKYMDIIPIVATAKAANVQSCIEVQADPTSRSLIINQRDPSQPRGVLICGPVLPEAKIQEFFMVAYSRMSETSVNGPYNRLEQKINVTLRGDRDITTFISLIQGSLRAESGEKSLTSLGFEDWYTPEAAKFFAQSPIRDPGVISAPIVFGRERTPPSMLSKLWGSYEEKFKNLKD